MKLRNYNIRAVLPIIFFVIVLVAPHILSQPLSGGSMGGLVFSGNHKFPVSPYKTAPASRLSEKTRLDLTKEKRVNLKGKYSIAFRVSFWYNFAHGFIFGIENKKYSVKFIFGHHPDSSKIDLSLSLNNDPTDVMFRVERNEVYDGKWFDCSFEFDESKGVITGKINGETKVFRTKPFNWEGESSISFGADGITVDCAPMILKDLRIFIEGKLEHRWLFTEMEGNTAFDSEGNLDAHATHHLWLINQHFLPVKKDSFYVKASGDRALSLHKRRNEIIINHPDSITVYNLVFHTYISYPGKSKSQLGLPQEYLSDTLVWNSPSTIKDDAVNKLRFFLTQYPSKDSTLIMISYLRTPVLNSEQYKEMYENSPTRVKAWNQEILKWSLSGFGVLILLVTGYFAKKSIKRRKEMLEKEKEIQLNNAIIREYPDTNCISIFGGVKIVNREGINVADSLSPKLKELLAMIVFYSRKERDGSTKGVNFKLLEDIFWYNIQSENIKNNRNVTFANIRKALKNFENLTLNVKKNEVTFDYPEDISNKVQHYFSLVDYLDSTETAPDDPAFAAFAGIVSEGVALNELHSEWADNTRSIIRSKVISILERYLDLLFKRNDYKSCIKVAEIAILHDPLHESTLRYKIKSHVMLDEVKIAEECYSRFSKRYFEMYKEEFPFEFDELLED